MAGIIQGLLISIGSSGSAPVNTVAPLISGTFQVGFTLSVSTGTWTGSPTPTYTYQWRRGGGNISGATSSSYTLQTVDTGETVSCVVTATNTAGSASATSSNSGVVNGPPVNASPPTLNYSGSVEVGTSITCFAGNWYGWPGPTFAYQWQRNGSNISGATSSSYTTTASDTGTSIQCVVTATNALGSSSATSGSVSVYQEYIAVAHDTSPTISVYPFSVSSGFGSKFADPATLPAGFRGYRAAFTPNGNAIAVVNFNSPYVTAYPWSGSGFGAKYANPTTLPQGQAYDVSFDITANSIAVAHQSTPYVTAYPWSTSGFGAKYADPSSPVSGATGVKFSPDGGKIFIATNSGGNFYTWSSSTGFGSRSTTSSIGYSAATNKVSVSDTDAVFSSSVNPYIAAFLYFGSFSSRYSNPSTLPSSTDSPDVAFSKTGSGGIWGQRYVAATSTANPYLTIYYWTQYSGFGTQVYLPNKPNITTYSVEWNFDDRAIAVATGNSPYVEVYPFQGYQTGTKYANPATLPAGTGRGVTFGRIS